jgi:hypothetical protein
MTTLKTQRSLKIRRRPEPAGMIAELAYWDERRDGVCVPVTFATDRQAFACLVTRGAAQALAASQSLTARECFGVTYEHMREVAVIARAKAAARNIMSRTAVVIQRADVVAARMGRRAASEA